MKIQSLLLTIAILTLLSGCTLSSPKSLLAPKTVNTNQSEYDKELSIARLSERQGKNEQASAVYRQILSKDPDNQLALHRMGVVVGRDGNLDESISYFEKSRVAGNESAELLNDLGYVYYLKDDLNKAESILRQALTKNSNYKPAHNNLGLVVGQQGRYDEAIIEFRNAVDDAKAYSNLAYIQSQRGDFELSETNYHKAIEINKDLRVAAVALVQISQKTGNRTYPETQQLPSRQQIASATTPRSSKVEPTIIQMSSYNNQSHNQNVIPTSAIRNPQENAVSYASAEIAPNAKPSVQLIHNSNVSPSNSSYGSSSLLKQPSIIVNKELSETVTSSGLHIPSSSYRITDFSLQHQQSKTRLGFENPLR